MIIDTSALVAILEGEVEGAEFLDAIELSTARLLSAASFVETAMVVLSRRGEAGLSLFRSFLVDAQIQVVPFTAEQGELAVEAFRRFGKGRHRAGLNFGDCLSLALARATGEPLLFKGDDFAHVDIEPAA